MKRHQFLKKSLLGVLGLTALSKSASAKNSTYDKLMKNTDWRKDQVGFNHLPNKEVLKMKSVYHPANTRGHADHGWLNSHHTFSFANYYNPDRMHFGVLRVLNDDIVSAGRGFGTHPHDNMEIISIPLSGDLEHKDSMGNTTVIKEGDVQVMSAGTGIRHSEYNKNKDKEVRFLQIWMFPNRKNVEPRYDQQVIADTDSGKLKQILSPSKTDAGVWVHQNSWWHMGDLLPGDEECYKLKDKTNGVYAFLIEGSVEINGQKMNKRDGFGVWDLDEINIKSETNSKLLLMEVPMGM